MWSLQEPSQKLSEPLPPALEGLDHDLIVIKFDGVTGDEVWRTVLPSAFDSVNNRLQRVVVDPSSYVYALGRNADTISNDIDFTLLKLSGSDGTLLWQTTIPKQRGATDPGDRLSRECHCWR